MANLLKFEEYSRPESTLQDYGTVREQVGKKGTIALSEGNFNNPDKRVAIILKRADGTSKIISCSKRVSDGLRAGKVSLAEVLEMRIVMGENEVPFIASNGKIQEFNVDEIKPVTVKTTGFLSEDKMKMLLEAAV